MFDLDLICVQLPGGQSGLIARVLLQKEHLPGLPKRRSNSFDRLLLVCQEVWGQVTLDPIIVSAGIEMVAHPPANICQKLASVGETLIEGWARSCLVERPVEPFTPSKARKERREPDIDPDAVLDGQEKRKRTPVTKYSPEQYDSSNFKTPAKAASGKSSSAQASPVPPRKKKLISETETKKSGSGSSASLRSSKVPAATKKLRKDSTGDQNSGLSDAESVSETASATDHSSGSLKSPATKSSSEAAAPSPAPLDHIYDKFASLIDTHLSRVQESLEEVRADAKKRDKMLEQKEKEKERLQEEKIKALQETLQAEQKLALDALRRSSSSSKSSEVRPASSLSTPGRPERQAVQQNLRSAPTCVTAPQVGAAQNFAPAGRLAPDLSPQAAVSVPRAGQTRTLSPAFDQVLGAPARATSPQVETVCNSASAQHSRLGAVSSLSSERMPVGECVPSASSAHVPAAFHLPGPTAVDGSAPIQHAPPFGMPVSFAENSLSVVSDFPFGSFPVQSSPSQVLQLQSLLESVHRRENQLLQTFHGRDNQAGDFAQLSSIFPNFPRSFGRF